MLKYRYQGKFAPEKLAQDNIDRLSTGLIRPNLKILELGCANGFMTRYFREKLGCQVVSVDINPETKPEIVGDLNRPEVWQSIKKQAPFDVVFASAILEHLPQPEITLQLIKAVLKPKGELIVTLPNISHWRQRLERLLGRFEYEDFGQLDRTHLRFFNYYSAKKLIRDAGFKIKKVLLDPAGGIKYFNWLIKPWPNLYAYQICIYATKR
jgi:SAM-dependent methyltransferase